MSIVLPTLSTLPAHSLTERREEQKWLIDQLWTIGGVGIIGGEPKCYKSFLALSIAIAVSSGVACLGKYKVQHQGRVVLYAAEDAPHIVKGRLEGICRNNNLELKSLDIQVITVPTLRLDKESDQEKLKNTIEQLRPQLLILDPFVRLHRIDENASGEVAAILASLRDIQRIYQTAIIVVHHSKKGGASSRAGQALRGSSEFHAWGDVNLYLRRDRNDQLFLSVEHRDAKSQSGIPIQLIEENGSIILRVTDTDNSKDNSKIKKLSISEQIDKIYDEHNTPLSFTEIRSKIGARAINVGQTIRELVAEKRLEKVSGGYRKMISPHQ